MIIIKTLLTIFLYIFSSFSLQTRHFLQSSEHLSQCTQQSSTIISLNNHCELSFSSCLQQPQHIIKISSCLYCKQQSLQQCPYLQYLPEVDCIQKCCPYSGYFLSSLASDRLENCLVFTNIQKNSYGTNINNNEWMHDRVMFPILIVIVVLLVVTFIVLLVKTVMHLWLLYGNLDKREDQENLNNSNTTQEHEEIPEWVYY